MKINFGLSGFLAPDGQFFECMYQEHQRLASKLVVEYKIQFHGSSNEIPSFIKFGCHPWVGKEGDGGCHCFIWEEPTDEQLNFIRSNFQRMTKQQQLSVLRDLNSFNLDVKQLDALYSG
ncbi:MAG: hypothetical protein ACE3L7_32600 [Candidatus Pristimantibacillus sp.]